jgi:alpha-amylase/alpha-mannosidase (GH57 family)
MIKPQGCFMRYLCIHCHFYQPPRENPWLEQIEQQDSAAPYHDWNARINDECYARNAAARILDGRGRIDYIVNNYSRISFNFGPTLLSWMEQNAPETYGAILEADAESRGRFHGHGSAIAQVYNHMIMPLANTRDKRTQILWGIHDFRSRFGRLPEGMWLAETAASPSSLLRRPGRNATSAPRNGATSMAPASTPPAPTWSKPAPVPSTCFSTTVRCPAPSPSRAFSTTGSSSPNGC